jgi:enoyl-CoA hydratase
VIGVEIDEAVAVITLQRPEKRNALNTELCRELRDAVVSSCADGAKAIVLTGMGTTFCSGADLDAVYSSDFRDALYEMLHSVVDAPVPVLAAVNGPAIGAGTQLAIAADLRVVGPTAQFAVPTARIGLAVDPWTIRRLALLCGNAATRSMLLACETLDADDAMARGLADRIGSAEDTIAWAHHISRLAPLTVQYSKSALNSMFEPELNDAQDPAMFEAFERCWASEDFAEGRRARTEKRSPRFTGR